VNALRATQMIQTQLSALPPSLPLSLPPTPSASLSPATASTPLPPSVPVPTPKLKKSKSKTSGGKTENSDDSEQLKVANEIREKTERQNSVFKKITMTLDYTKNKQYPLVEFKTL
jgi:hypothetical protein